MEHGTSRNKKKSPTSLLFPDCNRRHRNFVLYKPTRKS